jgi:hypothetical protein
MALRVVFTSILILVLTSVFAQGVFTSTGGTTNWNATTSWTLNSGTDADGIPDSNDNVTIATGHSIDVNVNSACNNLGFAGTGNLNFPTNTRTLAVSGNVIMNGNSSITGNNNNRILTVAGDFTIPSGQIGSIGGVRVTQVVTSTLHLFGTMTPTDNTGTKTFGNAIFYNGCVIDASVTEGITIAGNLSIQPTSPGLHAKIGRVSITVTGTTTVIDQGYLEFTNSNSGTKTFNNTITVIAGGTWDNTIGEDPVVNCSIVNNGLWPAPTGGNGRYDVLVAGTYTYTGNTEIIMTRLNINSASTVTNLGALRLTKTGATDALTVNSNGVFNNGNGVAAAYLTFISTTISVSVGGGTSAVNFANNNNTVEYAAVAAQTVHPTTYFNLKVSNGFVKTINGAAAANGNVTIADNTTLDVSGGTDLSGTGTLIMNDGGLFRISSAGTVPALTGTPNTLDPNSTIEFYRAGTQTAASSANFPYQNVLISGNAGSAVNTSAVTAIQGNLSFTNAGSMNTNAVMAVTGNLSYASSASTTLSNNISVGSFAISSGTWVYSNRVITINGDNGEWTVSGAPVITSSGTSEVVFTTGINQQIAGTVSPSFTALTINNSNDVTLSIATATVSTTLNLTSGRLITGTNVVDVGTGAVNRASGFVEGNLRKTMPVGTTTKTFEVGTNTEYTPASLTTTSVTTQGSLTVRSNSGDHPEINSGLIEPNNTVNRYWSVTNTGIVFSAFSTGQISAIFNFVGTDKDAAVDNSAIIKWYNNTSLTWAGTNQFDELTEQNPVMTVSTNVITTVSNFAVLNPTQLPTGQRVDFQIGEKIDPTNVFNRLTGANNWNNKATWIQQRTGVISLTSGSATITGSSTNFQAELVVNDLIMLISTPGVVYTVTAIDPTLQQITVSPAPSLTTSGGYGRQYIPGINSPTSNVDAVVIGNNNIVDVATTITLDINAKILTLDIGSTALTTVHALTHQNSTRDLNVLANVSVNQPGASVTNAWNINAGTATVAGDVTIGSTNSNTITRVASVVITTGTANFSNIKFRTGASAGGNREDQARLDMSGGNGTLNISGAITFSSNRGRLASSATSTINFNRTVSGQSIVIPSNTAPATWAYNNINVSNTSTSGASIAFTVSATNVTGDLRVQPNANLKVAAFNIVGGATKTFELGAGSTFEMTSNNGGGIGGFPSGFGTFTIAPSSTVFYNQIGATNPWPISNQAYGNLVVGQNGSGRNFRIANTTTTVSGNLTIGDGTTAPTLLGQATGTLTVVGNILINSLATLDATNISAINVGGNWTRDGIFTPGTNQVTFNSPAANTLQLISGTAAQSFYDLRLNTSAASDEVRIGDNTTVTNTLTLTQGELNLNSNTLSITRSATSAIARTSGYIKSENSTAPYGSVKWTTGTTSGAFVFPFGKSSTEFIPFTYNITTPGAPATGTLTAATYPTVAANTPLPTSVNNLNGTTGGLSVADRFWMLTFANYTTTRPTATATFTILNSEVASVSPVPSDPLDELVAQRWNPANYWDPAVSSPAQVYTVGAPAANTSQVVLTGFQNNNTYEAWTLANKTAPLPIELVSFEAKANEGDVDLNWKTASELNNDYFTIERSTGSEKFEDVTRVKGAGTKQTESIYFSKDANPAFGLSYYRLKQTDFDGTVTVSKVVSVEVASENVWRTYPNPSDGAMLKIKMTSNESGREAFVGLKDVNGKDVMTQTSLVDESNLVTVEPSQKLSPGMYIVTIAVDNKISRQKLIVK